MQLLGPFGVKEWKKQSYGEQVAAEERRRFGYKSVGQTKTPACIVGGQAG